MTALLAAAQPPGSAVAAPDEEALGKGTGYPVQRLGPEFTFFREDTKVGTFSQLEKVFWPRTIAAGGMPSPLPKASAPLPAVSYVFEGQRYTIEDFLARQRITGLLVIQDGKVLLERYQYDRTDAHRFASFSMAKTVTAMLVGLALRDGRIGSLDDTAQQYAPELKDSAWGSISIRNLLRMSSGVRWSDAAVAGGGSDVARLTSESFFQRGRGGASAVSWARLSDHPQGTRFNYSSGETFALGVVLRGALGRDLAGYFSEKVWKPMGAEADASWLIDRSGQEAANCCINATLRDYGRLGVLLAADGMWNGQELLPREFLLDATDPDRQPEYLRPRRATAYFGYGYQTWLYPYRTRTFQARGLFGQELIVQPASRFVMVITSVSKTADAAPAVAVERNTVLGALLTALGGKADLYR